jgi:hypothetical protein
MLVRPIGWSFPTNLSLMRGCRRMTIDALLADTSERYVTKSLFLSEK